jgi:hypothetical protein
MKNKLEKSTLLYSILVVGVILLLTGLSSCKKNKDPEPPSAHDVQLGLIANTWVVKNETNGISLDGTDEIANWPNFTVTFTAEKTYSASGVSDGREIVWPLSGTWEFKSDTDLNTVVRDDGVEIAIIVDEASLKMSFNYTKPNGKVSGTEGAWIFNMLAN